NIHRARFNAGDEQWLAGAVRTFATSRPGLVTEPKPGAVALHYRKRPDLEGDCLQYSAGLAREHAGVHLLRGKKVVELKLSARTKGDAIADLMREAPFAGRQPFFAGDDATD